MSIHHRIRGFIEWKLKEGDRVVRSGRGENLVVNYGRQVPQADALTSYPTGRYLYIADDYPGGAPRDIVPELNSLFSAVGTDGDFAGVRIDITNTGWDRPTLTRTVQGTFLSPSVQRRVTHIGIMFQSTGVGSTSASGSGVHQGIFSALKIDPPIIQEITQTLEVTYEVVVLPQTDKQLGRFPAAGRDMNRVWLEHYLVDTSGGKFGHLVPHTLSRYWFLDEGAVFHGGFANNIHYRNAWNQTTGMAAQSRVPYAAVSTTRLAADDVFWNGAFGGIAGSHAPNDIPSSASSFITYSDTCSVYKPMALDYGKVGPLVFPHPIGRAEMFNETAIDKTGQGDLEIRGPYIPVDAENGAPQHWCYHVAITSSGDTDDGTEGAYIFSRTAWYSYPRISQADTRTTSDTLTFVADDGGSGNSAITRASGEFGPHRGDFHRHGRVTVSGTTSNDGVYDIINVEPGKITLRGLVLTDEGPTSATLTSVDEATVDGNGSRFLGSGIGGQGWRTEHIRDERNDPTFGTNSARYNCYRLVWDGMDSYWGLSYRDMDGDGSRYTAVRWRAMTPEQEFRGTPNNLNPSLGAGNTGNPWTDTTRFVKHSDGLPIDDTTVESYGLASNRAGLVFFGQRNSNDVSGDNQVFIIDNSKPGRWYQRPSGTVDGSGNFTVDAGDEIHAMFPFEAGDASGSAMINIIDGPNAGLHAISSFTNANEVALAGGGFTVDSNVTWHWTTIDATEPDVGEIRGLVWDRVNSRLWVLGSLGLKHSDDDGQTWSTLLDENEATTPLIDSESRTDIRVGSVNHGHGGYDVDANGDLYWLSVDTGGSGEYWVNKLELNAGIGVDAVHSRIGLGADFPGTNKPSTLDYLFWEKGVDNPTQLGALWFLADTDAEDSWYRMPVDAGAIDAAPQIARIAEHDPTTIVNLPSGYDHASQFLTDAAGNVWLRENSSGLTWQHFDPRYADQPDEAYRDWAGDIEDAGIYHGSVGQEALRPDGCFWLTQNNANHGWFGSLQLYHRYAPAADVGGQSGGAASIVAGAAAGRVRVQGLTGMTADSVGRHLQITGAASAGNNATVIIAAVNSGSEVDVYNVNGVTGDANNGSISWQEQESEWVPWAGSSNQFDDWYGTVSGGNRPMHDDFRELRDNVQVAFTQAGGATAPEDEFVDGECFVFIASFGEHKTNVEDMTFSGYWSYANNEYLVESEDIKNATGPGSVAVYHQADSSFTAATPAVIDSYPVSASGKFWGNVPFTGYSHYGQGVNPDSDSGTGERPSFRTGLDLGAATEIDQLVLVIAHGSSGFNTSPLWFSQTATSRYVDLRVFTAPDETTLPTEIDSDLAWPAGDLANYIRIEQNPAGWENQFDYSQYKITIDLAGAGLSAGQRTARFWQVVAAANSASAINAIKLTSIYALDSSGNPTIGLGADNRVDDALDDDFSAVALQEVFWIQNVHGGGDPGAGTVISTSDDGDGDGFTDRVTLDSGLFDTANIDITQDFLAWKEPGDISVGYRRPTVLGDSVTGPRALSEVTNPETVARAFQSDQTMSRIIDISTPGQIIVEDDIIPDNLSGVEWEVRRPAPLDTSRTVTDTDTVYYDFRTGFLDHHEANESASRRFRVTRKVVFRK